MEEDSDHIKWLKEEWENLGSLILGLSYEEDADDQVKSWKRNAWELYYNMEDAIATHKVESISAEDIANSLIDEAIETEIKLNKLKISKHNASSSSTTSEPEDVDESSRALDASALVGLEGPTEKLIKLLDRKATSTTRHRVVSIVGMAGLGKTTLALHVFHQIKSKFDCTAFVSVSRKSNMKRVFAEILSGFGYDLLTLHQLCQLDLPRLLSIIQDYVHNKRFFLVADDIWSENDWMLITYGLFHNPSGGSIITTTRINDVAMGCSRSFGSSVYRIDTLSTIDSERLFSNTVFGHKKCPSYLEDNRKRILEKCDGLPLAIVTLSNMLVDKESATHWDQVYNSINNAVPEYHIGSIRRTFSLSFYDLPYHLRMCLLYLTVFPEGYEIKRKRLVYRWIAEGFVQEQFGKSAVEVGKHYFNELVNRNLIQPVNVKHDGQARACRVHKAIFHFIASKSLEENFVTLLGGQWQRKGEAQDNIHILSIQNMKVVTKTVVEDVSHVRSLTIFGPIEEMSTHPKFSALRVLDVEDCDQSAGDFAVENNAIVNAGNQLHLRYLKFGSTCIKRIPEEVGELLHLETLDLRKIRLQEVPAEVNNLQQLLRLFIAIDTKLPGGIGKMRALEEIKYVNLCKQSKELLEELGHLTNLRVIGIYFHESESLNEKLPVLVSSLSKLSKSNLRSLSIDGDGISILPMEVHVSDGASITPKEHETSAAKTISWQSALPCLVKLSIRSCYIPRVPIWMRSLKNLEKLRLGVFEIGQDELEILGGLPCLLDLFLDLSKIPNGRLVVFSDRAGFNCLKCLGISRRMDTKVKFRAGSMQWLDHLNLELHVDNCCSSDFHFGIKHLSSLTTVDVKLYGSGQLEAAKDVITKSVEQHPSRPTLNINHYLGNDRENRTKEEYCHAGLPREGECRVDMHGGSDLVGSSCITAAGGSLASLLKKLTSLSLNRSCNADKLKKEMQIVHEVLLDMSDKESPGPQLKQWMNKIRELGYDMEDAIDKLMILTSKNEHVGSAHEMTNDPNFVGQITNAIQHFVECIRRLPFDCGIPMEIQRLKDRVAATEERRKRPSRDDNTSSTPCHDASAVARSKASRMDPTQLVGIDGPRGDIIGMLNVRGSAWGKRRKVACVAGSWGIGKTTLVKQVFEDIADQFHCSAFVTVSRNPNIKKLLRDILVSFGSEDNPKDLRELDHHHLIKKLHVYTREKRYLVVIDNIWMKDQWATLKEALCDNYCGSTIIVTTRNNDVTEQCCFDSGCIYRMKPLGTSDSERLLLGKVFGHQGCPPNLSDACANILKKCGGCPLAIVTLSGLLATKATEHEWDSVIDYLGSTAREHNHADVMRKILALSYDDLPQHLKTCLLYLSTFPQDIVIKRKNLVHKWIAEGLVHACCTRRLIDVGASYFKELIKRSMIQPVNIKYDGEARACQVQDTIHDFITYKSVEDNFVTLLGSVERRSAGCKFRRLSVQKTELDDNVQLGGQDVSHVRSFSVFGVFKGLPPLHDYSNLRVLDLQYSGLHDLTQNGNTTAKQLKHIEKLFLLKYLALGPGISEIQEGIEGLHYLETLDLTRSQVVELPSSITEMRRLVRLFVNQYIKLPDRIDRMEALEEIKEFAVHSQSKEFLENLGELEMLRFLKICWSSRKMQIEDKESSFMTSLRKLCSHNLQSLSIIMDGSSIPNIDQWFVQHGDNNVYILRKFSLNCSPITRVPTSLTVLTNLEKVSLAVSVMEQEDLDILGKLVNLLYLLIRVAPQLGTQEKLVISSSTGFKSLKYFDLEMHQMNIKFESGCTPRLEQLKLEFYPSFTMSTCRSFNFGIEHLASSITTVDVSLKFAFGYQDEVASKAEHSINHATSNMLPNRPTVKISKRDDPSAKEYTDEEDEEDGEQQHEHLFDIGIDFPKRTKGKGAHKNSGSKIKKEDKRTKEETTTKSTVPTLMPTTLQKQRAIVNRSTKPQVQPRRHKLLSPTGHP